MKISDWLDQCRSDVATGKQLPHQYVEQVRIALVEKEISNDEFTQRVNSIPFCPAYQRRGR